MGKSSSKLAAVAGDGSWLDDSERPSQVGDEGKDAYRQCTYQSQYVPMRDGVRLAVDILLPSKCCGGGAAVPVVFIQCRYMRGAALRWPFSIMTRGLPVDFIGQELKTTLLAAGYAVASIDVRGTGASFGRWRALWSPEERQDSVEVVDWIARQRWCSGQVILYGMSYEAGAALFTLAAGHPAVKGSVLMYPFWDLYTDISCPGGVPQGSFTRTWSRLCLGLDANNVGSLALLLKVFFSGVQPVITAPRPTGSIFSLEYWKAWMQYQRAAAMGQKLVRQAVAGHRSFNVEEASKFVRFTDQLDPQSGLPITAASACSKAAEIAAADVPLLLVSGWMDATAAAAISAYFYAGKAAGSQLLMGPWTHSGLLDNSVGHHRHGAPSRFGSRAHILRFIEQALEGAHAGQQAQRWQELNGPAGGSVPEEGAVGRTQAQPEVAAVAARALAPSFAPTMPLSASARYARGPPPSSVWQVASNEDPVHYFTMGYMPGWRSSTAWPPPQHGNAAKMLYLAGVDSPEHGGLADEVPGFSARWEHVIDAGKHPKGVSRYDCITDLTKPMVYKDLDSCGHLTFTSAPLKQALEVTGWAQVELWVEPCDTDADLFCYLESYDPLTGDVAYITEGTFRASHHKLQEKLQPDDPRRCAQPPGLPFHSFEQMDAQLLAAGRPIRCHFTLLPTSFAFAPGHCVRLAISGSDSKHFQNDLPCNGTRRFWIRAGQETVSCIHLPCQVPYV